MSGSTTRKKIPKKNVSKEAMKVTALKKREVTVRAMAIIERMIEEKVDEKWLLDSVHSITQDQYHDVTEERAITKLCGYPMCCHVLKDVPSKTYHISTKRNKIYDITDRKNFCSNGCYKASCYLKNQLLSSPLWLRDAEERPDYNILHLGKGGILGAEVDLGYQRVSLSDVHLPAKEDMDDEANVTPSKTSDKSSQIKNNSSSMVKSEKLEPKFKNQTNFTASETGSINKKTKEDTRKAELFEHIKSEERRVKSVCDLLGKSEGVEGTSLEEMKVSRKKETSDSETSDAKKYQCDNDRINDSNEVKTKFLNSVKSVHNKFKSLEIADAIDKPVKLVNSLHNKPNNLKTTCLDLSSFSLNENSSEEIFAKIEPCLIVSKEKNTGNCEKELNSISSESGSLTELLSNESDSKLTKNESHLVSHEVKNQQILTESESDSNSNKNELASRLSENEPKLELTKEGKVNFLKNESNVLSFKSEDLQPTCKNESNLKSKKKRTTKDSINKTNLLSCSEKRSKVASENESDLVSVVGKTTEHSFKNKSDLKLSKTESDTKKWSVYKKERQKTKKQEEKIDQKAALLEVVKHIEKCLREWITFDSLIFLFGEESVKKALETKGSDFKECQTLCGTDASTYEKYLRICRKLNMLELEDARADAAAKEKNADLKPLPDYSLLKREAKQLEIKVRSFYEGNTRIEMPEEAVGESKEEEENEVVLPLVDMHAQKALRRRIVLDRLNVILPDLGRTLNLSIFNLTSAVRNLSQTFSFSSNNITFKPPEWYFIAMILVKLLSLQDKNMKIILESGSSEKYLTLLLMNWGLDGGYLDRLVQWLTDIDYLLQKTS